MISTKTNALLFLCATLSTGAIVAMEEQYKMTIENQLYVPMFLNVKDPALLTDQSPYPYVKGRRTKTFLLSDKEAANQSIAVPGGYPANKVHLPINKKETHFTIKNHPEKRQVTIIEDDSKNVISELLIMCNSK